MCVIMYAYIYLYIFSYVCAGVSEYAKASAFGGIMLRRVCMWGWGDHAKACVCGCQKTICRSQSVLSCHVGPRG